MGNNKRKFISMKEVIMHCKKNENSDNSKDQGIYASVARISDNEKSPSRYYGDSFQLTNWIFMFNTLKLRMDITSQRSKNDK